MTYAESVDRYIKSLNQEISDRKAAINDMNHFDIESMPSQVDGLMVAAGKLAAFNIIKNSLPDSSLDRILSRLLGEALRDDDTWSGRGNDIRRSYKDGFRAVVLDFRMDIECGLVTQPNG